MHGEDGSGSIILRSAYVCLCVTEHWRGSLADACVCLYLCVCAGEREGGIMGEAKDEENERAAQKMSHWEDLQVLILAN